MIHFSKYLFFLIMGSLVISCSSTRDLPVKTIFPFDHERERYELISISSPSGEGMNYLTQVKGDSTVLKCLDMDQDGVLDIIQYGKLDLDQVNFIYQVGIQKAVEAGKFRKREGNRSFEFIANDTSYTIETVGNYMDQIYNRFTVLPLRSKNTSVFLDQDANGTLDEKETGTMNLQKARQKYQKLIQLGLENAQIHLRNEKIIVKFRNSPPSS